MIWILLLLQYISHASTKYDLTENQGLWEGRGIYNTQCLIPIHYQQFLEFISLLILQFESLALAECSCFVSGILRVAVTVLLVGFLVG